MISKLQPFRRSRALFRMMPLSLPRYTFLSEFIGAGRAGRAEETAAISFSRAIKKKKKKWESSSESGGKEKAFRKMWRRSRRGNPSQLGPPQPK